MSKNNQALLKPPVNSNLFDEIVKRIKKKINPEKIILFGSYAYGKPEKDSDIDFLVIKNTKLPVSQRYAMISSALFPRTIPMDFIVRTPKEMKKHLSGFNPFYKEIMSKGKVLYER